MVMFNGIKKEWDKIKKLPSERRFGYFWDYYKWHVFGILFAVFFIGMTIYQKATAVEYDTYGAMFNVTELDQGEMLDAMTAGFEEQKNLHVGIKTDLVYFEGDEFVTSNYETMQIFGTLVLAGEIDFVIADAETIELLAKQGYLMELPESAKGVSGLTTHVLDVSDSEMLKDIYGNLSDSLALGIMAGTEKLTETLAFVQYLQE